VRLRPGEELVGAAHIDAVCLDLRAGDDLGLVSRAHDAVLAAGLAVRVRSPEVLFDTDRDWTAAIATLDWEVVYARHVAALGWAAAARLEYPLQGLHAGAAVVLGAAGVVAAPEQTLDELSRLTTATAVESLVFGREQVLVSRDTLGLAEGLVVPPARGRGPAAPVALTLTDARGYAFPVMVAAGETRVFNARVTNLCGHLAELTTAGVRGLLVVPSDMREAERRAFFRDGLAGLAAFDDRERFTTGHLFRGVA